MQSLRPSLTEINAVTGQKQFTDKSLTLVRWLNNPLCHTDNNKQLGYLTDVGLFAVAMSSNCKIMDVFKTSKVGVCDAFLKHL